MKTLACSLIALAGWALSSVVFAARPDDGEITGRIVSVSEGSIEIDDGKGRFEIIWDTLEGRVAAPKVGEKVRVHYYHCGSGRARGGFHHCADKIEKLSNAEKGSKKN
jgi:hypothetical protein